MDKQTFRGRPYRVTAALGDSKWSIYGEDDQRQERYLGRVLKEQGTYKVIVAYSKEVVSEDVEDFQEAVEELYEACLASGYLTQGHQNYLGGSSD